jgi:hypothetical protein
MYDCFTKRGIFQIHETPAPATRIGGVARIAGATVKFAPVEQATDGPREG